ISFHNNKEYNLFWCHHKCDTHIYNDVYSATLGFKAYNLSRTAITIKLGGAINLRHRWDSGRRPYENQFLGYAELSVKSYLIKHKRIEVEEY
ncbi:MAG: hypothetical protein JKX95_05100, partial [Bacteroidia bacterium]|nr:hypothetical protein [Bacteroidia bacterium]